jgi:antitoxin CptB
MLKSDSLRRLRWQCRRGLLELDILLGHFLETHYDQLSDEKKAEFTALLQCSDQELLYWFTHQTIPPDELKEIVAAVVSGSP